MDQPFYWNNTLLSPSDTQALPDYLLSPSDTNMDFQNVAHHDIESSSSWTSLDPNATEFRRSQGNHDGSKLEEGWNTALLLNSGGGPRLEDGHPERTRILSLGNMDINLNSTRADEGQSLAEALSFSQLSQQTTENNAKLVGTHAEIAEIPMHFHIPGPFELERVPSSNSDGSSSSGVGLALSDSDGGLGSAMEGYRLACKRKNIEGAIGKSSASVNTLFFQQNDSNNGNPSLQTHGTAENASNTSSMPGTNSFVEQLIPSLSTIDGGVSSECEPSSSITEKAETSLRNFRVRLNPENQHTMASPKSYPAVYNSRPSSIWSHGEPSSLLSSLNHSPVESLPVPPFPCLPGNVFLSKNAASSSRCASSSRSGNSEQRSINLCDESNMSSMPSDVSDHSALCIGTNTGHLVQGPPTGNLSNANVTMTGKLPSTSRASSSSRVDSFQGLIRLLPELASVQYPRNMSEIVFSSSLPSVGPVSGCQSSNFSALPSGQSASSQESGQSSGAYPQGRSQNTRSTISLDRQRDGMRSVPFSIRNREGRDRMISEIRNVLELMRRGDNLHFEDSLIRDHYAFLEHVDLHDRHRDMRLDVDNMSYEELLALEDRIGYVSTGLGEDAILKNLRQLKFSSCKLELASAEHEPCCICREEYTEGEDIGMLGCSHDFHTACIKQWLMIKNLCPICKTTAFVT